MTSDSETVAEIVEMLRRFATGDELPTDEIPSFTHLADRIEVAYNKEIKTLLKIANLNCRVGQCDRE